MNKIPRILCLITMALMLLVLAQGSWHFIPVKELRGATYSVERTKPTIGTILDGSWQAQMEEYYKTNFGFRELSIRLYNQYVWSCFHHSNNKGVVPGRDGYLYERYFVEDYYESRMYKYTENPQELRDKFDLEARRLAKLQAILREYGTYIFVSIQPGKDMLYPEHLPPQDTMTRVPGPRAYTEYVQLFDKYGVEYIDILSWFQHIKDSVPYDLMTPLGTHWSNIAATYAFDSIMQYMQHQLGGPAIRPVHLGEPYVDEVREPDNDLGLLLNLLFTPQQKLDHYVDVCLGPSGNTSKPSLIVLGDSFFWNISYNYPLDSLFRYTHYWFYYNTVYFDPEHDNVSQFDLLDALMDADYVMLNYCSGQLYDLGNNAIGKALVACCYDEDEIQAVRESIGEKIRADEQWFSHLKKKSEQENIPLEQAILNDANYLISVRPEEFFPAIVGDGVPTKRSQHILKYKRL